MFAEREPPDTKTPVSLFNEPGILAAYSVGTGPIRAMQVMNNVIYVVSGSHLWSIDIHSVITDLGSVGSATGPVQLANNGAQMFILNNQAGYVLAAALEASLGPVGSGQGEVLVGSTTSVAVAGSTGDTFLRVQPNNTIPFWQIGDKLVLQLDNGNQFTVTLTTLPLLPYIQINPNLSGGNANTFSEVVDLTQTNVSTQVTATALSGTNTVQVFSTYGMVAGDSVQISLDTGADYTGTIFNLFQGPYLNFTPPLPSGISVGQGVSNTTVRIYPVTDINFYPADSVAYFDDYFVFNRSGTNQYFLSALGDGTTFPPLYFASAQVDSDFVTSVIADHEMLLIFGSSTIESWYDAGTTNFPFQRYDGATIQRGTIASLSVVKEDNAVFFLGDDVVFYRLQGVLPVRVSTHAIEFAWNEYSTVTDAVSYSYTYQGHKFIVVNFPSGNATWVYDISTGLWHERNSYNAAGSLIGRWRGNCVITYLGRLLVGDFLAGTVGTIDENIFTEFGVPMIGQAISPPFREDRKRIFVSRFELEMQVGLGSGSTSPVITLLSALPSAASTGNEVVDLTADPQVPRFFTKLSADALAGANQISVESAAEIGINDQLSITLDDGTVYLTGVKSILDIAEPKIYLDYSKDGGHSFSLPQLPRSLGNGAAFNTRIRWLRLGQAREWYFRITITDPVPRVIIAAYADLYPGT
jgi:hypothetical protein